MSVSGVTLGPSGNHATCAECAHRARLVAGLEHENRRKREQISLLQRDVATNEYNIGKLAADSRAHEATVHPTVYKVLAQDVNRATADVVITAMRQANPGCTYDLVHGPNCTGAQCVGSQHTIRQVIRRAGVSA